MNTRNVSWMVGFPVLACSLAGCPWIGPVAADARFDVDGDGVPYPEDCDEGNPLVLPGATELCNGLDDDCDGAPGPDEADADGDGVRVCAGDCDDSNAAVSPEKVEVCGNGVDEDCIADPSVCRWSGAEPLAAAERILGDASGFGYALTAGDWNGDGDVDLAVGSPISKDAGQVVVGAVHLFQGPLGVADRGMEEASASLYGSQTNDLAGFAVGNGGGADANDLVVATAPQWSDGSQPRGAVLRASGEQIGAGTLGMLFSGTQTFLGVTMASLGDPDGDGYNTLVTTQDFGVVQFDLRFDPSTHPFQRMWTYGCGRSTAIANPGDIDGDGLTDLALGQATCGDSSGDVYVIDGALIIDNVEVQDVLLTRLRGTGEGSGLGYALSGGRDVTGDGRVDLVASELYGGPPATDADGSFDTSAVWVVAGRSTFPDVLMQADADALISGPAARYVPVIAVHAETDLDGDAIGEVLLGAPLAGEGGVGEVGVFYGPFSGAVAWDAAAAVFQGPELSAGVGQAFAALGDVNADGAEDVAIGSADFETAGAAYILLGRAQ